MTDWLGDVRYGFRRLVQSPAFTLVAVSSLALGIGFNTAIFSAVDAVLLRPKAGIEADRLVEIYLSDASGYPYGVSSYPDYREYRDRANVFAGVAAFQTTMAHYRSGESSEYLLGEVVSGNFFELLGIGVLRGRPIEPSDDVIPGGHPVVVISSRLWRDRLGSDPEVVGKSLELNGRPYTILGVTDFTGSLPGLRSMFWAPAAMLDDLNPSRDGRSRLERRTSRSWLVRARLAPGVTVERAQARMDVLARELQEDYPDGYRDRRIHLLPSADVRLHPVVDRALFPVATVLMAIVGLVLLIACANVANMALARATARRGEVAMRLALGATRWRLARQLLTESLLLSGLGGALGLWVAYATTELLLALRPPIPIPVALDSRLDGRVLFFTFAVSVGAGILFGLAPAIQSGRLNLVPALANSPGVVGRRRRLSLRNALVVLQVSVSLVLLVGGGLMLRSVANAQSIDPGFETDNVVMLSTHLGLHGYDEQTGPLFFERAVERLRSLPGIEAASLTTKVPLGTGIWLRTMAPEGREPERIADWPNVDATTISPGYFETMGIPLVQGRDFSMQDDGDAPKVMIVSEAAARRFWPGENPIGKRMVTRQGESRELWEVIGVARDTKVRTLGEAPRPQAYFAARQDYSPVMYLLARTRGESEAALEQVRRELLAMDGSLAFFEAKTMRQNLAIGLFPVRMGALLLGAFGALALLLASVGLYGVVAYTVSRRTREIGIRMALGADRRSVLLLLAKQGLTLVGVGCALGLAGSVLATRVLASVLYGIGSTDLATFAATAFLLVVVASVANWIPARRAARVEPMRALRYE